jgi:hypothetical protein
MGSADFKIVRPVGVTADGAFSRAGPKNAWDATGTLVQVAANVLAMSYDPGDLTAAPEPLIESTATNLIPSPGSVLAGWNQNGGSYQFAQFPDPMGTNRASRWSLTPGSGLYLRMWVGNGDSYGGPAMVSGQQYTLSVFFRLVSGTGSLRIGQELPAAQMYIDLSNMNTANVGPVVTSGAIDCGNGWFRLFVTVTGDTSSGNPTFIFYSDTATATLDVFGDDIEIGPMSSYIEGTRAADVFSPVVGLSYSNVPILEPTYSSTATYATNALVYDPATRLTYLSLIDANKGKLLTDTTAWAKQLTTNRWSMFDKAVNSQTSASNLLVVAVNAGALVNTIGLLNVDGSRVTVTQMDSGYIKSKSLVQHDVLSWYDWFYEEPVREGDVIFDDIPPYATSPLIISVENPGDYAAIGCICMGKSRTIGQTDWGFTGGVLSYSTSTTDTFGQITLVKRANAKTLNFDVFIQPGFESVVYRWMEKDYTDVELFIIGAEDYSMTYSYGYLGQWSIPVSNDAKTASIEFKGLA